MNHSRFLVLGLLALTAVGCKKTELEGITSIKPNNSSLGVQCLNKRPIESETRFRSLVFFDGFDDAIPGDPCYSKAPNCSTRLDWLNNNKCNFDANDEKYRGLRNLNKCTWKVWNGYNFWADKNLRYSPDAISVDSGTLKLKMMKNPDYDPNGPKCGTRSQADSGNDKFYNLNCPVTLGGIDSKYGDTAYPGRSVLRGRIEMKARYVVKNSSGVGYMALWMWPNWAGKGVPYASNNSTLDAEIDIMEADVREGKNYMFQSYHNWNPAGGTAFIAKGRTLNLSDWHRYGVEWTADSMKFYVDDCYTFEVKNGDLSTNGQRDKVMQISDRASYMMLNLSANHLTNFEAQDYMEIDEVKIFE